MNVELCEPLSWICEVARLNRFHLRMNIKDKTLAASQSMMDYELGLYKLTREGMEEGVSASLDSMGI